MKKLLLVLPLIFIGCTSVHFTETLKDQTVKEFSYFNSIFSKEITDFSYTGEGDGTKRTVQLGSSSSDMSQFVALLQTVMDNAFKAGQLAKKGVGVP